MSLVEVKGEIPSTAVDSANDVLLEQGLENWSVVEDVVAKRAWLVGICGSENQATADATKVEGLLAAIGIATIGGFSRRAMADADWRDSYKAHFRAWQFGRLHWVPVWERGTFSLPEGDAVLWLDPGLAFGTGNHETTRLCVERLVTLAESRGVTGRVIDAGCGSGILALSAALLGYRSVEGFDNDPEAVRVSVENADLNGLASRVAFRVADLASGLAGESAEVVLANIQADVLMHHAKELIAAVAPGGSLVLSGILARENGDVRARFESHAHNWLVNARIMGEWSDVVLTRPPA